MITRSRATRWLMLIAAGVCSYAQNTGSGTLMLGKEKYELKYASAILVPDSFDKAKTKTRIVLMDKPVPEDLLDDESQLWGLKDSGYHGVEIEIDQDKASYSVFVISASIEGSRTLSGTLDQKRLIAFTKERAEGSLESAPSEVGGTMLGFQLKFAVNVLPQEAPPTAADAAAAVSRESVKSYLALVDAIRTGNKQKILELAPPEKRAMIDTPDFPQVLKMVQQMTPTKIQILKAVETGDRAKILARGVADGEKQRGKIYLQRMNGKWIMVSEAWGRE